MKTAIAIIFLFFSSNCKAWDDIQTVHNLSHYAAGTIIAESWEVLFKLHPKDKLSFLQKFLIETGSALVANEFYELVTEKDSETSVERDSMAVLGAATVSFTYNF